MLHVRLPPEMGMKPTNKYLPPRQSTLAAIGTGQSGAEGGGADDGGADGSSFLGLVDGLFSR